MDATEIAEMVRDLKLSREGGSSGITVTREEKERGTERLAKTVVGKICARRQVNKETLRTHLPRILRTRGGVEMEMMGHNIFIVEFSMEADKRVALEEGPWHFFQDLMLFREASPMQSVAETPFDEISLWIQCHNVPMVCMDADILRRIGEKVGKIEEIEMGERGVSLGRLIRMRVRRKLDEALVRCVPVTSEDSEEETMIIIKYEKLPHFCFVCGKIGHIQKDCGEEGCDRRTVRYDSRLRAGTNYMIKNYPSRSGGNMSPVKGSKGMVVRHQSEGEGHRGEDQRESERGTREDKDDTEETLSGGEEEAITSRLNDGRDEEYGGNNNMEDEGGEEEGLEAMEGETMRVSRDLKRGGGGMGKEMQVGICMGSGSVIKSSPKKRKKKGEGKRWKKRAREVGLERDVGMVELEVPEGLLGGKRGSLEIEKEDQNPNKKVLRMVKATRSLNFETAATAEQSRRDQ